MQRLIELWNEDVDFAFWQMLLIGLFFMVCNFGLFCATWMMKKYSLLEYGYPKRKKKNLQKRIKTFSFTEKLFLIRIVKEADQQGFFSYMQLVFQFANITAFCISIVGFVSALITCASGWAMLLLTTPVFAVMMITIAIGFIPDLIYLPSERKRYKLK